MAENSVVSPQASVRPGIFDRSVAGTAMAPVTVQIERDRIRFFAKVLGLTEPVHENVSAAREAGYPDLLAPPSFLMAVEALAEDERARHGMPGWMKLLRCDMRHLLHGNEAYSYSGPIFAGDEVVFGTEFLAFEDKKGGALEVAQIALHISHPVRGPLVSAKRTLLHRLS
jgi:hypothetical protein